MLCLHAAVFVLLFTQQLDFSTLLGTAVGLSNAFGLIVSILLLGYGLVRRGRGRGWHPSIHVWCFGAQRSLAWRLTDVAGARQAYKGPRRHGAASDQIMRVGIRPKARTLSARTARGAPCTWVQVEIPRRLWKSSPETQLKWCAHR